MLRFSGTWEDISTHTYSTTYIQRSKLCWNGLIDRMERRQNTENTKTNYTTQYLISVWLSGDQCVSIYKKQQSHDWWHQSKHCPMLFYYLLCGRGDQQLCVWEGTLTEVLAVSRKSVSQISVTHCWRWQGLRWDFSLWNLIKVYVTLKEVPVSTVKTV